MKKSKRFLSILCAACMVLAMSAPAFAADAKPTAEKYAYMDIDTASPVLRDKILAAQCEIVYGDQAWTVGGVAYRTLPNGTRESLPEFSALFPGWDVSEISEYAYLHSSDTTAVSIRSVNDTIGFDGVRTIPTASASSGLNFYSFTGDGREIHAWAKNIPADKYNIAVRDDDLKIDVAYEPNTTPGEDMGCSFTSESTHRYNCRASSAGVSGDAHLYVKAI